MQTQGHRLRFDRSTNPPVRLVVLFTVLPFISGCGFLFVEGPPPDHESRDYFSCTESKTGPILDQIWAGLNAGGATLAALNPDQYENSGQIIAVGVGWTIVSGAAGIIGNNRVENCREAKASLAQRQADGPATLRPDTGTVDTLPEAREIPADSGDFEHPVSPKPVQAQPDTTAPDTLEIWHTEYSNPWLTPSDFRSDREICENAVEDRLRDGPEVTREQFESDVRRCLAGKGWNLVVGE